jgi:hypothetical protein
VQNSFFRRQWFLLYTVVPEGQPVDLTVVDPARMQRLIPPSDRYWADPFPTRRDGRSYILFEEVEYASDIGHLSAIELGPDGPVGEPARILTREHHLSYPFLLHWEGEDYLIPESMGTGRLEYFRSRNYPWEWEHAGVLLEQPVADASITRINGRWWMFAVSDDGYGAVSELLLFHGGSPFGPWEPHTCNPIKRNVRGARPGGRPFRHQGRWYRVGQDSSHHYGRALVLFEILRIDEERYEEREVRAIEPWRSDVLSVHTLNEDQGLIVADAEQLAWTPPWLR